MLFMWVYLWWKTKQCQFYIMWGKTLFRIFYKYLLIIPYKNVNDEAVKELFKFYKLWQDFIEKSFLFLSAWNMKLQKFNFYFVEFYSQKFSFAFNFNIHYFEWFSMFLKFQCYFFKYFFCGFNFNVIHILGILIFWILSFS